MKPPFSIAGRIAALVGLVLILTNAAAASHVTVGPIVLVVGDLEKAQGFYTQVLDFTVAPSVPAPDRVPPTHLPSRSILLQLGEEQLQLVQFPRDSGRPIPPDSRSNDHWFQHVALVVSDLDRAYRRLVQHRVRSVSLEPQTLPAWNRTAGGIQAFYFADPEGHLLELIAFPKGKGAPRWHPPESNGSAAQSRPLFLGIDHTAIVVADTERSLRFYRNQLGLEIAGRSENWGPEQERLNHVPGAHLRITTLRGMGGPGIELLEYLAPRDGRPLPPGASVTDLLAWRISVHGTDPSRGPAPGLVRDPDGHLLDLKP